MFIKITKLVNCFDKDDKFYNTNNNRPVLNKKSKAYDILKIVIQHFTSAEVNKLSL